MIALLTGRIVHKADGQAILDVNGVGFRLAMSAGSLAALPAEGDEVTVHTHLHVREDEMSLFGFESVSEKLAFEQLITVSGVGPKVALATLSALTPDVLAGAIASEDVALISTVPGVGKKTAQRIILDLTGKLAASTRGEGSVAAGRAAVSEATDALLAMGFSPAEAATALAGCDVDAGDTQALVTSALKRLGTGR